MHNELFLSNLILSLAGALILLLLAIIGYFLKQQITASQALTDAVNSLTTTVQVMQARQEDQHPVIESRLTSHGKRLDCHDKQITVIETKLNINK